MPDPLLFEIYRPEGPKPDVMSDPLALDPGFAAWYKTEVYKLQTIFPVGKRVPKMFGFMRESPASTSDLLDDSVTPSKLKKILPVVYVSADDEEDELPTGFKQWLLDYAYRLNGRNGTSSFGNVLVAKPWGYEGRHLRSSFLVPTFDIPYFENGQIKPAEVQLLCETFTGDPDSSPLPLLYAAGSNSNPILDRIGDISVILHTANGTNPFISKQFPKKRSSLMRNLSLNHNTTSFIPSGTSQRLAYAYDNFQEMDRFYNFVMKLMLFNQSKS